jgi:hypothetical protein
VPFKKIAKPIYVPVGFAIGSLKVYFDALNPEPARQKGDQIKPSNQRLSFSGC